MKLLFLIVFLGLGIKLSAQINLVPNPSFEVYDTCPNSFSEIQHAIPWFQPYQPQGSSDYFNSCNAAGSVSVPMNYFGWQYPHSGSAYSGITLGYFNGSNYREYIEVELNTPLQNGWKYAFSMYVCLSDYSKRACDAIGAYFSISILTYNNPQWGVLNYTPQARNVLGNVITDTANWILIADTFLAQGGEKFITIGNFLQDSSTNWIAYNPTALYLASYYYIDDVSVVLCDRITGIEVLTERDVTVAPNPASDKIKIGLAYAFQNDAIILMYTSVGELIFEKPFVAEVDVGDLPKGVYFLVVDTWNGKMVKKVVKW